jgi:ketosteroid isomerase-like protein
MALTETDSAVVLEATIERYNAAWNDHDLDAIVSMHAPDMVFSPLRATSAAAGRQPPPASEIS